MTRRALIASVAFATVLFAAHGPIRQALIRDARAITDAAAREILSRETWEPHRAQRLEEMRDMMGLLPWPKRTPLNVQITGKLDRPEYTVERIAFESLPKVYVTANLYIPKNRRGRVPAVVYVCGHSYSPYGAKVQYQRHGISLAKNGYAAIVIDPIQIAETFALHHGIHNQQIYEWYARGYTPAGVEVWNAIRAIDYLETRPEIDAARIGMTGRSGGAAMTWFTAAVEPRVKVAVPVMGISTYAANLEENTQRRHCDCMFLINTYRHGMLHQGALIAPRPLLMAHGRLDLLFPVAGYEEFERRVSALYASYGKRDAFKNIVVNTGHKDSDYLREQAIRWFDKYLMGVEGRELDMTYENEPGEALAVFPDGPPADARNYRVHEIFLPTPEFRKFDSLAAWKKRREELMKLLRTRVFRNLPKEAPTLEAREERLPGEGMRDVYFTSEPGLELHGLIIRPGDAEGPLPALLYVASDNDDRGYLQRIFRAPRPEPDYVRFAVYPRGVGAPPLAHNLWLDLFRNAMHTGNTLDSLRAWDVLRAFELLRSDKAVDGDRITVAGRGQAGILALYAAILDERIHQVLLLDPPSSHVEGPYFLNILRYTDLPEAAALLAPRRLNFYNRIPKAFEPTREIYKLYGKPDHVFLTMEMMNVVTGRYDHRFSSGL